MHINTSIFRIEESSFGNFKLLKLLNSETLEYVTVVTDFGDNVNKIALHKGGRNFSIIEGSATQKEMMENSNFKSAKLVPFANRINNGKYSFNGVRLS